MKLTHLMAALLGLSLAAATQAPAKGWVSADFGRTEDYRKAGISGGGALDKENFWTLEGSAEKALSFVGGNEIQRTGELGAGLGYSPEKAWDLSLDGLYGGDDHDLRFGGGGVTLGTTAGKDNGKIRFTLGGGTTHYLFAPEESLRQNNAWLGLNQHLGPYFTVGASGGAYAYDRDLREDSSSSSAAQGADGLFGLLGPNNAAGNLASSPGGSTQLNPLLSGLPTLEWAVSLSLALGSAKLGADYSQSELAENGSWTKLAGAFWEQAIGASLSSKLAWSKAVENGPDSPYLNLALTWSLGKNSDSEAAD